MFFSDDILSKRGPLAKVWLAAHAERRLTKTQLLQTDIEQSVESIIGPDVAPMALRLSGQLLLGVVRIYSRKAKYLLDDCNDALTKLKTAFRTGAMDFTTETARASHNNVTLPVTRTTFDLMLPDPALEGWDAESSVGGRDSAAGKPSQAGKYTARPADITLRRYLDPMYQSSAESMVGWASGDFFDPDGSNSDAAAAQLQRRDSQGRLVDENGDLIMEDEAVGDTSSIGIGRDAQMQQGGARPSITLGGDITGFDDFGGGADDFLLQGMEGEDISGGLDLGLEQFDAERRSATPARQDDSSLLQNLSPRTAKRVQQAAEKRMASAQKSRKLQRIDTRTQLDDSDRRATQGSTEGIVLAERSLLPPSREHLYLLSVEQDPSKGLLPFVAPDATGRQSFLGAQMLAPQLSELLTFDVAALGRRRPAPIEEEEEEPLQKRLRGASEQEQADEDDFGSEIGRRRAPDASQLLDITMGGDIDLPEMSGGMTFDDLEMGFDMPDAPGAETSQAPASQGLRRSQRKRPSDLPSLQEEEEDRRRRAFHESGALRRLSTPSEQSFGDLPHVALDTDLSPTSSYPLRAFDEAGGESSLLGQVGAISRNTTRAIKVLRHELRHEDDEEEEAPEGLAFSQVTRQASRRAAAAFFFEVLALGTKDCLDVTQEEPYGEITIEAKPSLWTL